MAKAPSATKSPVAPPPPAPAPPALNSGIRDLQGTLVDQLHKLESSLDDTSDPNAAEAIVREMQELSHRIGMAGSLLFTQQSAALDQKVDKIKAATAQVDAAVAHLSTMSAFVGAMSDFLGLVDEALDLAKTL
ncbi:MAG TPA: hypothetical protein VMU33_03245 [Burkholderiaceae bacterium]|nr:hypothetical protein [Burkholderiaceae bacterium]